MSDYEKLRDEAAENAFLDPDGPLMEGIIGCDFYEIFTLGADWAHELGKRARLNLRRAIQEKAAAHDDGAIAYSVKCAELAEAKALIETMASALSDANEHLEIDNDGEDPMGDTEHSIKRALAAWKKWKGGE